ncbi:MAG: hypothetical protein AB1Z98_14930 [Nannocystaceae bacterium]
MTKNLQTDALVVLRALFELADVDVRADRALLARLLGLDEAAVDASIAQLRRGGLVAAERLTMTMVGLAMALALPPTEPRPMAQRVEQRLLAA